MTEKEDGTIGETHEELAARLSAAGRAVEGQKKARREKEVKGSHLLDALLKRATDRGLRVDDKSGFHMVTGAAGKSRRVYVAKKGGRVDLSGFTIERDGIVQVSAEDAKTKHLGKVRGQVDFDRADDEVIAAFDAALAALDEVPASVAQASTETHTPDSEQAASA